GVLEALRDATYRRGWIETRDALQLIGLRRAHSFCSELDDVERVRSLSPGTWCRVPGTRYLMRFPLSIKHVSQRRVTHSRGENEHARVLPRCVEEASIRTGGGKNDVDRRRQRVRLYDGGRRWHLAPQNQLPLIQDTQRSQTGTFERIE